MRADPHIDERPLLDIGSTPSAVQRGLLAVLIRIEERLAAVERIAYHRLTPTQRKALAAEET